MNTKPEFVEVEAPDGSVIEFPSSMNDEDIGSAMRKLYPPENVSSPVADEPLAKTDITPSAPDAGPFVQAPPSEGQTSAMPAVPIPKEWLPEPSAPSSPSSDTPSVSPLVDSDLATAEAQGLPTEIQPAQSTPAIPVEATRKQGQMTIAKVAAMTPIVNKKKASLDEAEKELRALARHGQAFVAPGQDTSGRGVTTRVAPARGMEYALKDPEFKRMYDAARSKYDMAKKEYDPWRVAYEKASGAFNKTVLAEVQEEVRNNSDSYVELSDSGKPNADIDKLDELVSSTLRKYGIQEDDLPRQTLSQSRLLVPGTLKPSPSERWKEAQPAYDLLLLQAKETAEVARALKSISEEAKPLIESNKAISGIVSKYEAPIRQTVATMQARNDAWMQQKQQQFRDEVTLLNKDETAALKAVVADKQRAGEALKQQKTALDRQLASGALGRQQYEEAVSAWQQEAKRMGEGYNESIEGLQAIMLQRQNRHSMLFQEQTAAEAKEREKVYGAILADMAKKVGSEMDADPVLKREYDAIYKEAADKYYKGIADRQVEGSFSHQLRKLVSENAVLNNPLLRVQIQAPLAMVERTTETLGQSIMQLSDPGSDMWKLGRAMSIVLDNPPQKMFTLEELPQMTAIDVGDNLGALVGGMLPSLAAGAVVAGMSGGIGAPPVIVAGLAGAARFLTESGQQAGSAYQESLAEHGDLARAEEAYAKTWTAQIQLTPAYVAGGLIFTPKLLSGFSSKAARVGIGSAAEFGEELVQETLQGVIYEPNIRAGNNPWDNFWERMDAPFEPGAEGPKGEPGSAFEVTLVNILGTPLLGGAGQVGSRSSAEMTRDRVLAYMQESGLPKEAMPSIGHLAAAYSMQGEDFTRMLITSLYTGGVVDEATAGTLSKAVDSMKKSYAEGKAMGLTANDTSALVNLRAKQEAAAHQALEFEEGTAEHMALKQLSVQYGNAAAAVTDRTSGGVVQVQKADGSMLFMPTTVALESMASNPMMADMMTAKNGVVVTAYGQGDKDFAMALDQYRKETPLRAKQRADDAERARIESEKARNEQDAQDSLAERQRQRNTPPVPDTPAQEVEWTLNTSYDPIPQSKVEGLDGKVAEYQGEMGVVEVDEGGKVTFTTNDGSTTYELGNSVALDPRTFHALHVATDEEMNLLVNDDGSVTYNDVAYVGDIEAGTTRNNRGEVVSVALTAPNGAPRVFTGEVASQIAYENHLRKLALMDEATQEKIAEDVEQQAAAASERIEERNKGAKQRRAARKRRTESKRARQRAKDARRGSRKDSPGKTGPADTGADSARGDGQTAAEPTTTVDDEPGTSKDADTSPQAGSETDGGKVDDDAAASEDRSEGAVKPDLPRPTIEQIFEDVKAGRTVSFVYGSMEEVPEQLRSKVSSVTEENIGGKKVTKVIVTLAQSEADYLLQQQADGQAKQLDGKSEGAVTPEDPTEEEGPESEEGLYTSAEELEPIAESYEDQGLTNQASVIRDLIKAMRSVSGTEGVLMPTIHLHSTTRSYRAAVGRLSGGTQSGSDTVGFVIDETGELHVDLEEVGNVNPNDLQGTMARRAVAMHEVGHLVHRAALMKQVHSDPALAKYIIQQMDRIANRSPEVKAMMDWYRGNPAHKNWSDARLADEAITEFVARLANGTLTLQDPTIWQQVVNLLAWLAEKMGIPALKASRLESSAIRNYALYVGNQMRKGAVIDGTKLSNLSDEVLNSIADVKRRGDFVDVQIGGATMSYSYAGIGANRTKEEGDALRSAMRDEKLGATNELLRGSYGWFRAPADKKWRLEFTDHTAKLRLDVTNILRNAPQYSAASYKVTSQEEEMREQDSDDAFLAGMSADFEKSQAVRSSYPLRDILDHEELFKKYPSLGSIQVDFVRVNPGESVFGYYIHSPKPVIGITQNVLTDKGDGVLSTLLHEIQHAIQRQEGFAAGADADSSVSIDAAPDRVVENIRVALLAELTEEVNRREEEIKILRAMQSGKVSTSAMMDMEWAEDKLRQTRNAAFRVFDYSGDQVEQAQAMAKLNAAKDAEAKARAVIYTQAGLRPNSLHMQGKGIGLLTELYSMGDMDTLMREQEKVSSKISPIRDATVEQLRRDPNVNYRAYLRIAGEIEARDTTDRMLLTPKERAETIPYESQGIPESEMLVVYDKLFSPSMSEQQERGQQLLFSSTGVESPTEFTKQTVEDRDAVWDEFGVVLARSYADPQASVFTTRSGQRMLVSEPPGVTYNAVSVRKPGGVSVGMMVYDWMPGKGSIVPGHGANQQSIKVDKNHRGDGIAVAMMDFVADLRGAKWDISAIDRNEPISASAINLFEAYIKSRPDKVKNVEASMERLAYARIQQEGSAQGMFEEYTRGLEVYDDHHDYPGGPAVFVLYHGTTHPNIEVFRETGDPRGFLGPGPYFTSSEQDANDNYAGVGPDLRYRIESLAEEILQNMQDDTEYATEVLNDYYENTPDVDLVQGWQDNDGEIDDAVFDKAFMDHASDAADFSARRSLIGTAPGGVMMKVYVRTERPADITGRRESPRLTFEEEQDEDGEFTGEVSGTLQEWIEATQEVADEYNFDSSDYTQELIEYGDGIPMLNVYRAMEGKGFYAEDPNTGLNIGTSGVFRIIAQRAGYDAVVMDAYSAFRNMGVEQGTVHVVPFVDDVVDQVKSVTGNVGTYGKVREISFSSTGESNSNPFEGRETPTTPIGDTKTVTVDGKERTVFNSNGKPIHPTVEGVRNFWRRFGESKYVDSLGRPLPFYHGTKGDFDEFKARYDDGMISVSRSPEFASNWVTGKMDGDASRNYPEDAKEADRKRRNKWVEERIKYDKDGNYTHPDGSPMTDEEFGNILSMARDQYDGVFKYTADSSVMEVYVASSKPFDPSKDYSLIEPLLRTMPSMQGIVEGGKHKEGHWVVYENTKVKDWLQDNGYDSVMVRESSAELGGEVETVNVWQNTRIKSATGNNGYFGLDTPNINFSSTGSTGQSSYLPPHNNPSYRAFRNAVNKMKAASQATTKSVTNLRRSSTRNVDEKVAKLATEVRTQIRAQANMATKSFNLGQLVGKMAGVQKGKQQGLAAGLRQGRYQATAEERARIKEAREDFSKKVYELLYGKPDPTTGKRVGGMRQLNAVQQKSIALRAAKVNPASAKQVENFIEYVGRVVENANYDAQLSKLKGLVKKAKGLRKHKTIPLNHKRALEALGNIVPSLVDDIDAFVDEIEQYMATFAPVSRGYMQGNSTRMMDLASIAEQDAAMYYKEQLMTGFGIDVTPEEAIEVYNALMSDNIDQFQLNLSEAKKKALHDRLKTIAAYSQMGLEEYDTSSLTDAKMLAVVEALRQVNVSVLSPEQLKQYILTTDNIIVNDSFYGAYRTMALYEAVRGADRLGEITSKHALRMAWSSKGGKFAQEQMYSVSDMFRFFTGISPEIADFQEALGYSDYRRGKDQYNREIYEQTESLMKFYEQLYEKHKTMHDPEVRISEGVMAYAMQEIEGYTEEQSFGHRKNMLRQAIENMARDEYYAKEQALAQKVFTSVIEPFSSKQDAIRAYTAQYPSGWESINFLSKGFFGKYRDDILNFRENFYNEAVDRNLSMYLPIVYKRVGAKMLDEVEGNTQGVSVSQKNLAHPKAAANTTKRTGNISVSEETLIDFNLRRNSVRALGEALYDTRTSQGWERMRQTMNTPGFDDIVGGPQNARVMTERLNNLRRVESMDYVNRADHLDSAVLSLVKGARKFATVAALGGVTQIIKQPADQLTNAIINTGDIGVIRDFGSILSSIVMNNGKNPAGALLELSSIAERGRLVGGTQWDSDMRREVNRLGQAIHGRNKLKVDAFMESTTRVLMKSLQTGDTSAASAAWLSFYKKYLRDKGQRVLSWQEEADLVRSGDETRRLAMTYADTMNDMSQGSSDPSRMAIISQQGPDAFKNLAKAVLLPFSSFTVQMRARIINDVNDIVYYQKIVWKETDATLKGDYASRRDAAYRSLFATVAANAAFTVAKYAVAKYLVSLGASALLSIFGGADDDDERTALMWLAAGVDLLHTLRLMDADVNRSIQEAARVAQKDMGERQEMAENYWPRAARSALTEYTLGMVVGGTSNVVENSFGLFLYAMDYWSQVARGDERAMRKSDGQVMDFSAWLRDSDRHFWLKYKPDEIFGPGLLGVGADKVLGTFSKFSKAINPAEVGVTPSKKKSTSTSKSKPSSSKRKSRVRGGKSRGSRASGR